MTANILIVDDLDANIKLLEAKLASEYYVVHAATNGRQALKILGNYKIDVILLDIMMPGMDGFETCRRIKANPDTMYIPVVMLTALTEIEDRVKGLEAGADEFLTKPVNEVALFARVKSLMRMKNAIDQIEIRSKTNAEFGINSLVLDDNFIKNTVLIVDDDSVQARNISKVINKLTFQVKIFDCVLYSKGSTTLMTDIEAVVSEFRPDLIIISSHITSEDPLRICAALKSKPELKNSGFIMLAEDESKIVMKGLEIGINDYFVYPIDDNELMARTRSQLRRKKYQDQLNQDLTETLDSAVKDSLTNTFNRRYFDSHIKQLVDKSKETSKPLFLMMLDLDYFKDVNDTYGHQTGDYILKKFAEIMKDSVRVTDLIARYGGEEFIITVYDDINKSSVLEIANRIRTNLEKHNFVIPDINNHLRQTVSIGITDYRNSEDIDDFIKRSDEALYNAKQGGRNRIIML